MGGGGGGGAARDNRETMRNRERGKGGNPGVEEAGRGGGGVGNCGWKEGLEKDGKDVVTMEHPTNALTHQLYTNILIY